MLWIFNKKKIIKQNRADMAIQTCTFISDTLKQDIINKGWKGDSDIIGGDLLDMLDKRLNQIIDSAYENLEEE